MWIWCGLYEAFITPSVVISSDCSPLCSSILKVGSALSPNGLGLSNDGMMSMALMDKVISVNKEKMQV